MSKINKYTLDYIITEIKKKIPILTVVEESSLQMKKKGRNYFGICPFHREKTPSFSVSPDKNIFKCFSCGVGGDQIYLYARLNGIENKKAIWILAKRIGISGKKQNKGQMIRVSKQLEDKLLEKKFEDECKSLFDYLCSLRDWMNTTARTHSDMEQVEADVLLMSYYHEKAHHDNLINDLLVSLLDEINFVRQIDIYKIAKGVVDEWKQLLLKQELIFFENMD